MLYEELHAGPARVTRTVDLGRRERDPCTNKHEVFPEREGRTARLEIRAKRIELYRAHQHPEQLPDSLVLNFVEAADLVSTRTPGSPACGHRDRPHVDTEIADADTEIGVADSEIAGMRTCGSPHVDRAMS